MNYAEKLDNLIRSSYDANVKELGDLWNSMGLSNNEIEARMLTVREKVSDITTEMVECDRDNKMKIEEVCNNIKKDIRVLRKKLKMVGEPESLPHGLTLMEQQKMLKTSLIKLHEKRKEMMDQFRSLIDEEKSLACKLGMECVMIDEDTIPEKEDIQKVQDNLRTMTRVKEERETHMFTMKEEIVHLLEKLGTDMNATTLSSVLDGEDTLDSLKPVDLRSVQHTMDELKDVLDKRREEVLCLMGEISIMYDRLEIPVDDRCRISAGQVYGAEMLVKEEYLAILKEEKRKLVGIKRSKMTILIEQAKAELYTLWKQCLVGEKVQQLFLSKLNDHSDETLSSVEIEIVRLQKYFDQNKETFEKLMVFMDLCDLAQDLKERMQDPSRLFKSRGKAMVTEEQDRKKVNTIPRRKEELLALAEHKGNIIVFDEDLTSIVEDHAKLYEGPQTKRVDPSKSLVSTRSNKTLIGSSARSNKTASPRSTKRLGKFHTSPTARNMMQTRRTTPHVQQEVATRKVGKFGSTTPIARPSSKSSGSNSASMARKIQYPDLVPSLQLNDASMINESAFTSNVPYNSTVCYENVAQPLSDPLLEMENTAVMSGCIDKMLATRNDAMFKVPLSKIPRHGALLSTKATRKLRRSNSCSEITRFKRGEQGSRPRLGSKPENKENLAPVRESSADFSARSKMVRSRSTLSDRDGNSARAVNGRISRSGSSSNVVLR